MILRDSCNRSAVSKMNKRSFVLLLLMMFPFPGIDKIPEQRNPFPHAPVHAPLPDSVA